MGGKRFRNSFIYFFTCFIFSGFLSGSCKKGFFMWSFHSVICLNWGLSPFFECLPGCHCCLWKWFFSIMLSLYTPTGSNRASLTCMELTLKPLEALICKNVGLGPTEKVYFETWGSGTPIHTAVEMWGLYLIFLLPGLLILDWLGWAIMGGPGGQKAHPKGGLSWVLYSKVSSLCPDSAIQSWYQKQRNGIPREMKCIRFSVFLFFFWEDRPCLVRKYSTNMKNVLNSYSK